MYSKHTWVSREVIRREYLQNIEDGIYNEQERAIAAEQGLSGDVTTETERAVAREDSILARLTAVESGLTNEVSRATDAEGDISQEATDASDAVALEVIRASESELQIASDLATEIARAQQAEEDLHDYVDSKATSAYKPSGSIYFADLPPLTESRVGNVYDIKDDFVTNAYFVEGAGKPYKAGTNVTIVKIDENQEVDHYDAVTPQGSENPSSEGWYEEDNGAYIPTSDVTVISGKTYYEHSVVIEPVEVIRYDCYSGFVDLSEYVHYYDYASTSKGGTVKVDNDTIKIDANGVISSQSGGIDGLSVVDGKLCVTYLVQEVSE